MSSFQKEKRGKKKKTKPVFAGWKATNKGLLQGTLLGGYEAVRLI